MRRCRRLIFETIIASNGVETLTVYSAIRHRHPERRLFDCKEYEFTPAHRKISADSYFVYIITNKSKTILYTDKSNSLIQQLIEYYLNGHNSSAFTGRYNCRLRLYYDGFASPQDAIFRETAKGVKPAKEKQAYSRI